MKNYEKVLRENIEDYNLVPLTDLGYEDEEGDRLVITIKRTDDISKDLDTSNEIVKAFEKIGWYMVYREFPEMGFEQ